MAEVEFLEISGEIHEDPRGFSFFPWQDRLLEPGDLRRTFHLTSILPGQARGNHLHPGYREYLFTFHGAGVFLWEPRPGEVKKRLLTGNRTLILISPGIPHALSNPGPEILYLLAWRERSEAGPEEPETITHSSLSMTK
jgi:oxalate decarboxylase/phosphoglucose isomerase-like protein (cupin superfamily)